MCDPKLMLLLLAASLLPSCHSLAVQMPNAFGSVPDSAQFASRVATEDPDSHYAWYLRGEVSLKR